MLIASLDVSKGIQIDEKKKLVRGSTTRSMKPTPGPDDVRIFLRE
jgi:hypothetical protein